MTTNNNVRLWLQSLDHCSDEVLQPSLRQVRPVSRRDLEKVMNCEYCLSGNSTKKSWKSVTFEEKVAARPLQRVYSDVVGSTKTQSLVRLR